jgi:hypothetical protein
LLKYGHFPKSSSSTSTRDKYRCRSFSLDKYLRTHLDATTEFSSYVAKEPVFGNAETGVLMKGLDEKLSIPQGNGAVRKGS